MSTSVVVVLLHDFKPLDDLHEEIEYLCYLGDQIRKQHAYCLSVAGWFHSLISAEIANRRAEISSQLEANDCYIARLDNEMKDLVEADPDRFWRRYCKLKKMDV